MCVCVGGEYKKKNPQNLSHPPLQPPCPEVLKACLCGRLLGEGESCGAGGGRGIVPLWFFFLRGPPPQPCSLRGRSPSCGHLGGRLPSPLVSRCLQASESQSEHCPAGAERPADPWRRITVRPTPVRESFPVHTPCGKIHFSRDEEGLKNPLPSLNSSTLPLVTF